MLNQNDTQDTIRAIDRACDILFFLADQKGLTLPQIAKGSGLPKTTAFRILRTLEAKRMVALNPVSMTYSLGPSFFRLATTAISQMDIRDAAIPYMKNISDQLGANINLSIAQEDYRIIIERIESQGLYRLYRYTPIGIQLPLYSGAGGKAILAQMSKQDIDRIVQSQIAVGSSANGIDIEKLYVELDEIRQKGYASSWNELGVGAISIAVPLVCKGLHLIGSLNVSFPVENYHNEKNEAAIALLKKASQELAYYFG